MVDPEVRLEFEAEFGDANDRRVRIALRHDATAVRRAVASIVVAPAIKFQRLLERDAGEIPGTKVRRIRRRGRH